MRCHGERSRGISLRAVPANSRFLALLGDNEGEAGTARRRPPPRNLFHIAPQTQSLFGIVQGGMDRALRKESAERTIEIGFPGYAIGGLSVGEPRELTREIIESTLEHLPAKTSRAM
jgi:tRNA-guanine family transglycosylase